MADIVVVDDDPLTTEFMGEIVKGLGFTVSSAMTIGSAQASISPDTKVILVDVHLGIESGNDLIAWLAANPPTANIPVVAMTGSDDPETLATLDRLGVVALLPKPFDTGEVAALIQAVIETGPKQKGPPDGGL